jgi:sodium transport system ATP-binding protein
MLGGLFRPDQGRITVDGLDVARDPAAALARMGILGDAHGLYPRMTARENIVYYGRLQGLSAAQARSRSDALAELLDLQGVIDRRTEGFSQGERMKTALARALVHDPAHIVLDEPTNGLDVLATRALRQTLRMLAHEQGKCVVLSTHIMQEVEMLCDEVVVVSHGRSVATGSVAELKRATGHAQFEDAFVALAFSDPDRGPSAAPHAAQAGSTGTAHTAPAAGDCA